MQVGSRKEKPKGGRVASPRVPVASRPEERKPRDEPVLRLALSKGNLALELDGPLAIGPLTITDLAVLLPDVRFPVDLTGGVTRFRHRRGALARLSTTIKTDALATHVAPKLRGLVGPGTPNVVIAPVEGGVSIGVSSGAAALAFEVLVAPMGQDVRLVVDAPRGMGLDAPAFVVAARALAAMTKPYGTRRGGIMLVEEAVSALARRILPEAGARAPSVQGVELMLGRPSSLGLVTLVATEGGAPPALDRRTLRSLELYELAGRWDDRALDGDLDAARAGYLATLERAPRHPDVSLRLAAIDLAAGDRPEAALGTVVEAMPALDAGIIGAELLSAAGDSDGAYAAFLRAANDEPYGPLAALALLAAGRLAEDRAARVEALDAALVRAPGHLEARWERLAARLAVGDVRGATGDAEHLEAASSGASAKHAAALRAGHLFAERGHAAEAATRYERALRYTPSSAEGVLGLARALRDLGRGARALDLFARASALAEKNGRPLPACELDLAKALAEHARDLPAAIARTLAVPQQSEETFEARFFEARWRTDLGDLTGASRALGRLREAAEILPGPVEGRGKVARWLVLAAQIDERELYDLDAAHRDLALALRLSPRDPSIAAALRRVAQLVASSARAAVDASAAVEATSGPSPAARVDTPPREVSPSDGALSVDERREAVANVLADESDDADDGRVEELTAKLRANPADHAVALELARVLTVLGRDLELLALLSARIEEGSSEARADLSPMRREVLARLAASARTDGRASEAELYELMRDAED